MVKASDDNKLTLLRLVEENTQTGEKANFGLAFEEAFKLLNKVC